MKILIGCLLIALLVSGCERKSLGKVQIVGKEYTPATTSYDTYTDAQGRMEVRPNYHYERYILVVRDSFGRLHEEHVRRAIFYSVKENDSIMLP